MPGYSYSVLFIFVFVITLSYICLYREMLLKRSDEDGHSHFEARVAMYGMHSPCLLAHTIHRKYITKSVHHASRSHWESCSAVCSTGRSNSSSSSTGTTHLLQREKPKESDREWESEKERVAALSVVFIALKLLDFWKCVRLACICSFCHLCVIFKKRLFSFMTSPLRSSSLCHAIPFYPLCFNFIFPFYVATHTQLHHYNSKVR